MASQLTRDEVARIASLAQLDLSDAELDTFARQLTDIVSYTAIVQQADTSAFAADADAAAATANRADAPAPSLDRDVVLAEAPDASSGLFRVPKVR